MKKSRDRIIYRGRKPYPSEKQSQSDPKSDFQFEEDQKSKLLRLIQLSSDKEIELEKQKAIMNRLLEAVHNYLNTPSRKYPKEIREKVKEIDRPLRRLKKKVESSHPEISKRIYLALDLDYERGKKRFGSLVKELRKAVKEASKRPSGYASGNSKSRARKTLISNIANMLRQECDIKFTYSKKKSRTPRSNPNPRNLVRKVFEYVCRWDPEDKVWEKIDNEIQKVITEHTSKSYRLTSMEEASDANR